MTYLPDVTNICIGNEPVEKVMLGETQVWPYVDPFEVPDYVSGNTLAFKCLRSQHPELDGIDVSLVDYMRDSEGHLLGHYMFTDYDGNELVPTNAVITHLGSQTVYTSQLDENNWALFTFNKPVHTINCKVIASIYKQLFPVIPPTVKVLAGCFGIDNLDRTDLTENRFYIPEGVEVLSGCCAFQSRQFNEGAIYIPSTVHTIGYGGDYGDIDSDPRSALATWYRQHPQLFYYNGTYSDYKNITWLGGTSYYHQASGERGYDGYPVKCTDGIYLTPQ